MSLGPINGMFQKVELPSHAPKLTGIFHQSSTKPRAKMSWGDVREIRELNKHLSSDWNAHRKALYIKKKLRLPFAVSTIRHCLLNETFVEGIEVDNSGESVGKEFG